MGKDRAREYDVGFFCYLPVKQWQFMDLNCLQYIGKAQLVVEDLIYRVL